MKVWIDGGLVDEREARISVFDHGLVVGDGVFETVKVAHGVPFALTRHLTRLRRSALGFGLAEPDLDAIRSGVAAVVSASGAPELARVRITVTGGPAALGSDRGGGPQTAIVAIAPTRPWPPTADVVVAPWPRNERGALVGLKCTSYGENVRALGHAKEHGASEAIFANLAGNLCEGTGTNVFVVTGGRLVTPPLTAGPLAGVTRGLVLEWFGGEEADLPIAALAEADEAFLTSATRGVQPIRAVDGRPLPAAPGPVTLKARETYVREAAATPDP